MLARQRRVFVLDGGNLRYIGRADDVLRQAITRPVVSWDVTDSYRVGPLSKSTGEMAEWSMAVVLKTTVGETPPGVRIPLSPPFQ